MTDRKFQQPSEPTPGGQEPTQPPREPGNGPGQQPGNRRRTPEADLPAGRFAVAALAGAAVCLLAAPPVFGQVITPAYSFRAGAPLNQNYYNLAAYGRALQAFPPVAFPFNAPTFAGGPSPAVPQFFTGGGGLGFGVPVAGGITAYTGGGGPYAGGGYASPYYASPGYASPGYGSGSNPYSSYADPYGGGLRGPADAIRAQGQFEQDFQRARLLNQQVQQSKVETRRKIYDEWLYERAYGPTIVDQQERTQKLEQRRALAGMPLSEILSGYALNILLDDLKKKTNRNVKDPHGPIDPEVLRQINVTSQSGGNVGVLKPVKEGGALNWPLPLQGTAYQDEVRRLNQRAADAVKLVQNTGQVDPGTLNDMEEDLRRLHSKVSAHLDDLTPSQSIKANRFLSQVGDAVTALAQPDIASYLTDRFAARGKTVPELVDYMARKGLRFAPAVGGDEAAYSALYDSLAGYDLQAAQSNTRE